MAKFTWTGMAEFERKLSSLQWASEKVAKAAVYAGAGLVAAEIASGIRALHTTTAHRAIINFNKGWPSTITEEQRDGLLASLGIAKFRNDSGYINTKIGFDGYNSIKTDQFPKGQPNAMIARSCNRGSVAMTRQPFIDQAVSRARKRAEAVMEQVLDEEISKIMD